MKKGIFKFINIIIVIILAILIAASFFIQKQFPMVSLEELYFYATNGVANSDTDIFYVGLKACFPYVIALIIVFYAILYDITFGRAKIIYLTKRKQWQFYPFKIINKHRFIFTVLLFIISTIIALCNVNGIDFIKNSNSKSEFIESNYVEPKEENIIFKKKNNLILIFVESLETSMFNKKQGGSWDYQVTPELQKLLKEKDTTVFYKNKKAEEMKMIKGASWTTASLVANTSGIPFKIPIDGNSYHSKNFLNGAYTLGDVLKSNGYNNEMISAARTSFGGMYEYYKKHGDFNIIDYDSLVKENVIIPQNEQNPWGFSDQYLFENAKERLTYLASKEEPFDLQLITIDTHFTDGNIYDYSEDKYESQYENVFATTSKLIYEFVSWIKKQDFYEDTTIVIVGDHLSMQQNYFLEHGAEDRYIYNCYINSSVQAKKTKNRTYSALDTYPSIIAALGGTIKGDRLGLGVNLFSAKQTLAEKYTFDTLNKEVQKRSKFYNDKILGTDYIKMLIKEEWAVW